MVMRKIKDQPIQICSKHNRMQKLKNFKAIYFCTQKNCPLNYQLSCLRCRNQLHKDHSEFKSFWSSLLQTVDRRTQKAQSQTRQIFTKIQRIQSARKHLMSLQFQFSSQAARIQEEIQFLQSNKKSCLDIVSKFDQELQQSGNLQTCNQKLQQISQLLQFDHKRNMMDFKESLLKSFEERRKKQSEEYSKSLQDIRQNLTRIIQTIVNKQDSVVKRADVQFSPQEVLKEMLEGKSLLETHSLSVQKLYISYKRVSELNGLQPDCSIQQLYHSLSSTNDHYEQTIKELNEQIVDLNKQISGLKTKLIAMNQNKARGVRKAPSKPSEQIQKLREALSLKEEYQSMLISHIDQLTLKLDQSSSTRQTQQSQHLVSLVADLENRLNQVQLELSCQFQEKSNYLLNQLIKQHTSSEESLDLQEQLSKHKSQLEQLSQTMEQCERRVRGLQFLEKQKQSKERLKQSETKARQSELSQERRNREQLSKKYGKMVELSEYYKKQYFYLQETIRKAQRMLCERLARQDLESLHDLVEVACLRLQAVCEQEQSLRGQCKGLEDQLSRQRRQVSGLLSQLKQFQQEKIQSANQTQRLKQKCNCLALQTQKCQAVRLDLQSQLQGAVLLNERMRDQGQLQVVQNKQLRRKQEQLQIQVGTLKVQKGYQRDRTEELRRLLQRKNQQIQQLTARQRTCINTDGQDWRRKHKQSCQILQKFQCLYRIEHSQRTQLEAKLSAQRESSALVQAKAKHLQQQLCLTVQSLRELKFVQKQLLQKEGVIARINNEMQVLRSKYQQCKRKQLQSASKKKESEQIKILKELCANFQKKAEYVQKRSQQIQSEQSSKNKHYLNQIQVYSKTVKDKDSLIDKLKHQVLGLTEKCRGYIQLLRGEEPDLKNKLSQAKLRVNDMLKQNNKLKQQLRK